MVDSHCHLADDAFESDLEEVVGRAHDAGVSDGLCVLAMGEAAESARVPRVRALWPSLRFSIGIHPHQAGRFTQPIEASVAAVRHAAQSLGGVRAIGEIGLDYHYDLSPRPIQRDLFEAQLRLAGEMQLPVVVHTREAESDTRAILERAPAGLRGVLHCFTASAEMARWAVEFGFYVSFAGIVTFANAARLREVVTLVPEERLLVETDCPYLAPIPFRGRRNEPACVVEVARKVAELKGIDASTFDALVTRNFHALFGSEAAAAR